MLINHALQDICPLYCSDTHFADPGLVLQRECNNWLEGSVWVFGNCCGQPLGQLIISIARFVVAIFATPVAYLIGFGTLALKACFPIDKNRIMADCFKTILLEHTGFNPVCYVMQDKRGQQLGKGSVLMSAGGFNPPPAKEVVTDFSCHIRVPLPQTTGWRPPLRYVRDYSRENLGLVVEGECGMFCPYPRKVEARLGCFPPIKLPEQEMLTLIQELKDDFIRFLNPWLFQDLANIILEYCFGSRIQEYIDTSTGLKFIDDTRALVHLRDASPDQQADHSGKAYNMYVFNACVERTRPIVVCAGPCCRVREVITTIDPELPGIIKLELRKEVDTETVVYYINLRTYQQKVAGPNLELMDVFTIIAHTFRPEPTFGLLDATPMQGVVCVPEIGVLIGRRTDDGVLCGNWPGSANWVPLNANDPNPPLLFRRNYDWVEGYESRNWVEYLAELAHANH